jgi:hypothetical protein
MDDLLQLFDFCGAGNRDEKSILLSFDKAIEFISVTGGHCGDDVGIQSRFHGPGRSSSTVSMGMLHVRDHVAATGPCATPCKWCSRFPHKTPGNLFLMLTPSSTNAYVAGFALDSNNASPVTSQTCTVALQYRLGIRARDDNG